MFKPEYHVALESTWSADDATEEIAIVCAETEAAFGGEALWDAAESAPLSLYAGAAGTIVALETIRSRGLGRLTRSYVDAASTMVRRYFDDPARETGARTLSHLAGLSGIALVALALRSDALLEQRLASMLPGEIERETAVDDLPGFALLAVHRARATSSRLWIDRYRRAATSLIARRVDVGSLRFWRQAPARHYVGAAHGAATMLRLLGLGHPFNGLELTDALNETVEAFARLALEKEHATNWPYTLEDAGARHVRIQWCHGAAGIVTCLNAVPATSELAGELLVRGAQLVWQAGPLKAEAGLCHGTAGNGFALLAAFERTNDATWLARARAFAAHSIVQLRRSRETSRPRDCSLFTGDLGVAVFLSSCLRGIAGIPGVDRLPITIDT